MERFTAKIGHTIAVRKAFKMDDAEVLKADDVEVFAYGLFTILSTLVNAGVILGLAAIFGIFKDSLLYSCLFSAFQTTGGGFHASTHFRCFCVTVAGWAVNMLLMRVLSLPVLVVLAIWGIASVFSFAPIEHENAPMCEEKKAKMKRYVRCLAIGAVITAILLCMFGSPLLTPLLATLGTIGASMTGAMARQHARKQ